MEIKEITCTVCPKGCQIRVEAEGSEIKNITGYTCERGKKYAEKEVTSPERMLTSTVRVRGGAQPLVSVKTSIPVPKSQMLDCMREIRRMEADAPVCVGDVLLLDVCGTGADIVATRPLAKKC